jgi:outer membrane protein
VRIQFIAAPCLALLGALTVFGQTPIATGAGPKIAIIDMQSALVGTKDGQKAAADLKAKFTPREQDLQKKQQELAAKQDQYRKIENTISEEAKATLQRDIDGLTKSLQRDSDDARQDLDQEQQRILQDLGQKMMQVIQKYAGEKSLGMIFDVSGQPNNLIYAATSMDITRDIIALYDSSAPAAMAPAPKPAAAAPAAPRPAAPKPAAPAPAK